MAFICHATGRKCTECRYFRKNDRGRGACWAKQDGRKISEIIEEVWDFNQAEYPEGSLMRSFCIWVSFIMCYGHDYQEILDYANVRGIQHDPNDCDPDDPNDHYGALKITLEDIVWIKEELHGRKTGV